MSERARFIKFFLAGMVAAGINIGARLLLSIVFVYEIAVAIAFVFGLTAGFTLNRFFVFERSKTAAHIQYMRFAIVNLIVFIQVWLVSIGLDRWAFPAVGFTWHAETVAHTIGVASPIVTSYLAHRHFSFK